MLLRLLYPLLFILGPRLIPRVVRAVRLAWNLSFDARVPFLLKLLVPGTLVYFLMPIARLHLVGLAGYLVVLSAAVWLLINLSPLEVVSYHAPWRSRGRSAGRSKRDSSEVVDSTGWVVEEEERTR